MSGTEQTSISVDLPIPRIEIVQFNGHTGGFSIQRQLLWKAVIIGVNGKSFPASAYSGNKMKRAAETDAKFWNEFTGWPIIDRGRVHEYDDTPRG